MAEFTFKLKSNELVTFDRYEDIPEDFKGPLLVSVSKFKGLTMYVTKYSPAKELQEFRNGFKHFERSPMRTNMEADFDTGNMRFKARERYSFGYSDPRAVFGSPGA